VSGAGSIFDEYGLKARVLPAVLIGAPALTLLLFPTDKPFVGTISGLSFVGVITLAVQLLLHRGRTTEKRLTAAWGGLPTTLQLRHTDLGSAALRVRRRADVERVSGVALPTARRERDHPEEASEEIVHAVGLCIDRVRAGEVGSRLLLTENIAYGFRRNVRAGRPFGVGVAAFALGVSVLLTMTDGVSMGGVGVILINCVALLAWSTVINDRWVRDQADKYADRLFRTLEGTRADH
jgi:hypothetical protein